MRVFEKIWPYAAVCMCWHRFSHITSFCYGIIYSFGNKHIVFCNRKNSGEYMKKVKCKNKRYGNVYSLSNVFQKNYNYSFG